MPMHPSFLPAQTPGMMFTKHQAWLFLGGQFRVLGYIFLNYINWIHNGTNEPNNLLIKIDKWAPFPDDILLLNTYLPLNY